MVGRGAGEYEAAFVGVGFGEGVHLCCGWVAEVDCCWVASLWFGG